MTAEESLKPNLWQIDIAGLIVCLMVSFAAYGIGLRPWMEQRSTLDARRTELMEKRRRCSEISQSLAVLKHDVIHIRQELEEMEVTLQPTDRINQRLAELTDILGSCDMKIDTMQTGAIHQGPYCSFVPVDVAGHSDYLKCIAAMHQLHQRLPDMALVGFYLQGTPNSPEQGRQYALNLYWYAAPASGG